MLKQKPWQSQTVGFTGTWGIDFGMRLLSIGGFLAPALVHWMAPSFIGERFELTVSLSQVLFPFVIFVSILSWIETLVNLRGITFGWCPAMVSYVWLVQHYPCAATLWTSSGRSTTPRYLVDVATGCLFPALKRLWGYSTQFLWIFNPGSKIFWGNGEGCTDWHSGKDQYHCASLFGF